MARISFTFKNNVGTNASTTGSFLQAGSANLGTDDSSALRADGYTIPPSAPASSSSFSAIATDYDTVQLSWAITTTLVDPSSLVGDTPQAVSLALSYSPFGPPQTLLNGQTLETITANNSISTLPHHGLTGGAWAYYSLFVKYSSATGRSWYERLGSTEELVPFNYGSTDMLYRRIPLHYRLQDEQIGITNPFGSFPERTDIAMAGPLYRMLDVFGWDIDTIRTTVDYVMQQKDPRVANSNMLKNLALEVGLPLDIESLGAANLRNVLTDFSYLTQNEGLPTGVQEYVTAVSGCNTNITFNRSNLFSATQKAMSSVAVTTNGSSAPATGQWLLQHGTTGTPTLTCASVGTFTGKNIVTPTTALRITYSSGTGMQVACLKTKIQNVSQASNMYLDFGATYGSVTGASVLGWALSTTVQAASVVAFTTSTGTASSATSFIPTPTNGSTSVYEQPVYLGTPGNGTLTTTDMYLHMWVAMDANSESVFIVPNSINTLNNYPYYIDVESQKLNLVRDPQFANGVSTSAASSTVADKYWRADTGAGTVNINVTNRVLTLTNTLPTGASISSASFSSFYATTTYNTATPHGFATGDTVAVTGVTPSAYNHTSQVVVSSATQFFFIYFVAGVVYSSGGTATATATSGILTTNITNDGTNYNHTPLLRGINYYFSIDDINNNIYKVTLQNDDGTIVVAQATTVYRKDALTLGFRKYWQLTVPNTEPWYPLNSYKYSIHIWATVTNSIPMVVVTKPLFEPYAPGEYFDGNYENGGWLGGSDGGVGAINSNADYRWCNATAHTNFSYYTSDYNRSVNNVQQVIDNIVPATEYTTALASLRFNRIPGYLAAGQP